jgi:hypothetical protein
MDQIVAPIHTPHLDLGSKHGSEPMPPETHRLIADVNAVLV